MEYMLKDRSFEYSETEVKYELLTIGKPEEPNLYEIEFKLTFSYGFLDYAHNFVWLNEDVKVLTDQIGKMSGEDEGTMSVFSPGVSFSYIKDPHSEENLYEFTISMDTGYINSYMGTESKLSISIMVSQKEIHNWILPFSGVDAGNGLS